MGLVVSRYVTEDPEALLPILRARTESLLGSTVRLSLQPAGYHVMVDGLGVVVLERGDVREVRCAGMSWLAGASSRVRRVRAALRGLGGTEQRSLRSFAYRFTNKPPGADEVARALLGRTVPVQRFGRSAVLRAGWQTPVEVQIHDRGFDLEAPIVIFGKLHDRAVEAASALAVRIPLGS